MKTIIFLAEQGGVGKRQIISTVISLLLELNKKIMLIDLCKSYFEEIIDGSSNLIVLDKNFDSAEINLLAAKSKKDNFDYVLLNTNTIPDQTVRADMLFIITTPFRISVIKTKKIFAHLKKENFGKISLLVNKVGENRKFEYSSVFLEKIIGIAIEQEIPYDNNVIKSEQLGFPLINLNHEPQFILSIIKLLTKITDSPIPSSFMNILIKNNSMKKKLKTRVLG